MHTAPSLLLAALAPALPAAEVTIGASKDNSIYSESGAESNGAGSHFFAGATGFGEVRRGLIAFDVAAAVPPGSTITAVELTLYMSRTQAGPHDIQLHRVLADWGEGTSDAVGGEGAGAPAATNDATWTHRLYPSTSWAAPGGEFAAAASATTVVDQIAYSAWSGAGLVADVQGWLGAPATNFGWIVINTNELDTPTAKRFDSRQNASPAVRPSLRIVYDPPCGGSATSTCVAAPNSTGAGALMGQSGSLSVTANTFALTCIQLPPSTYFVFFFGSTQVQQPFGNGFLCVGGSVVRLNPPLPASASGTALRALDFTAPPVLGNIPGGSTRHFQCWYRNPAGGGAGFNLSDGLAVTFCN